MSIEPTFQSPAFYFRLVAKRVRHLPIIRNAEGLWSIFRKPYLKLLNAGHKGVPVHITGQIWVRLPAEYTTTAWEDYEPETMTAFVDWLRRHPGGQVLDVGSSVGIFSAVALCTGDDVNVTAFDSDLNSLAALRRHCQHAQGEQIQLVWGFLGDSGDVVQSLAAAVSETEQVLRDRAPSGDIGTTQYVCLDSCNDRTIPCRRLDDLLQNAESDSRPLLIKCDVEGAELLVLSGAEKTLKRSDACLLLSVHPPALPSYGHSVEDVRSYLREAGYTISVLGIDHEEHWWCEKARETPSNGDAIPPW